MLNETTPLDNKETLHLRCGSDIQQGLQQAGFIGDFFSFSDPYCQGPVKAEPDLIQARKDFIASSYGGRPEHTDKLQDMYDQLSSLGEYDEIVLWFEHDSYDQLILAYVLTRLVDLPPGRVSLICIDHFPGVEPFYGLGQLSPQQLRSLWSEKAPVTEAQFRLGEDVWQALIESEPTQLMEIASREDAEISQMPEALRRHLQELPDLQTGLSLTQKLALDAIAQGCQTCGQVFRWCHDHEPLVFLGDLMFWHELMLIASAKDPLVEIDGCPVERPDQTIRLTDVGRSVSCGHCNWMSMGGAHRELGGVSIRPNQDGWFWDAQRNQAVWLEITTAKDEKS